jgi:hypothetical protein
VPLFVRNRDISVGIATGNKLDDRGSIPGGGKRFFFLLHSVHAGSGIHQFSYSMGSGGSFPGVTRPGREAYQSLSSSAEVKNSGAIPSLPHVSVWHSA